MSTLQLLPENNNGPNFPPDGKPDSVLEGPFLSVSSHWLGPGSFSERSFLGSHGPPTCNLHVSPIIFLKLHFNPEMEAEYSFETSVLPAKLHSVTVHKS
jgi:hypothetical protein